MPLVGFSPSDYLRTKTNAPFANPPSSNTALLSSRQTSEPQAANISKNSLPAPCYHPSHRPQIARAKSSTSAVSEKYLAGGYSSTSAPIVRSLPASGQLR